LEIQSDASLEGLFLSLKQTIQPIIDLKELSLSLNTQKVLSPNQGINRLVDLLQSLTRTRLERFKLSCDQNTVTEEPVFLLMMRNIANFTCLKVLHIEFPFATLDFNDEGFNEFSSSLASFHGLTDLNVALEGFNGVTETSLKTLGVHIVNPDKLQSINLHLVSIGTPISDSSLLSWQQVFKKAQNLKNLKFEFNYLSMDNTVTDRALSAFADLNDESIEQLNLVFAVPKHSFTDEGLLLFDQKLQRLRNLRKLRLCFLSTEHEFTVNGVKPLLGTISHLTKLYDLQLSLNLKPNATFTESDMEDFVAALKNFWYLEEISLQIFGSGVKVSNYFVWKMLRNLSFDKRLKKIFLSFENAEIDLKSELMVKLPSMLSSLKRLKNIVLVVKHNSLEVSDKDLNSFVNQMKKRNKNLRYPFIKVK